MQVKTQMGAKFNHMPWTYLESVGPQEDAEVTLPDYLAFERPLISDESFKKGVQQSHIVEHFMTNFTQDVSMTKVN